jgi:predicted PurR-regulated permease PerM
VPPKLKDERANVPPMTDRGPSTIATVRVVSVVVAAGLLLYAAYHVRYILLLVLVSMFLAVGFDPLVRGLQRIKLSRAHAVLVVFLGAVMFIAGFFASVTPPLVRQTQKLVDEIPTYADDLAERSERFRDLDDRFEISERLRESTSDLPGFLGRGAGTALGVARSIGRIVFSVLTVTILTIYFLLDLPQLLEGAKRLLPLSRRAYYEQMSEVVFGRISGYLIGQLTVSLIAGVSSFVVLTILKVPFSVALAMWVAISALIPMVGATLGAIPAVHRRVLHLHPVGCRTVLVFFLVYQQVENYLVHPQGDAQSGGDLPGSGHPGRAHRGYRCSGSSERCSRYPIAASIKVLVREVWIPRQDVA